MILDTNALSALGNEEPAILRRLRRSDTPKPYLCFIALGSYRKGLLNSTRPEKPLSMLRHISERWNTLHSDEITVVHYAEIGNQLYASQRAAAVGKPPNDGVSKACCKHNDMTFLTPNSADSGLSKIFSCIPRSVLGEPDNVSLSRAQARVHVALPVHHFF